MQFILTTKVNLTENENEKYIYIIHFYGHPKIDEKIIVFTIWKLVQRPLDTMGHLFNLICKIIKPSCKCTCN
jgi:hypothetical protein